MGQGPASKFGFVSMEDKEPNDRELSATSTAVSSMSVLLSRAIAGLGAGVVVYGPDTRYLVWNDYMEHFTGMTARDVLGRMPLEVFPFLQGGGVMAMLDQALREGKSASAEFRFEVRQTGRSGWARDDTRPLRDEEGRIIGAIGTVIDVTQQRIAEDALRASEQRVRDMVDTTDGIVWEADAQTFTFTFVSRQAERLLGYALEDWLQPGFWVEKLHPEDRKWAPAYCAACTGRLEPHDFEYRFVAKDGRVVWLHDIVTVVAENGEPRWLRGIMVDVSVRVEAERSLRELAENLEQQVMERSTQVRQLAAQLTMAEERERRNLALELHDNLGQLLAVIKIRLCSLDQTPQTGQVSALTDLIHQAETTVRGITQQLSPPVLHALGLAQGLEWLGEEIERVYGLRVHVDHEVCGVHPTPEVQAVLYRSVRELLINVAKHAAADEASLTFLCKHGTLSLVVSDAGCGFDAARVRAADPEQGFGLRSIGERLRYLGGEIEIDSGPGSGTTVTLSMPCASRTEGGCGDTRDAG